MFIRHASTSSIFILVYVDDLIITGSNSQEVEHVITQLKLLFALKVLGQLNYFLGISITSNASGLHLSQGKYTSDLLE